jgi:hypothetical protein
MLTQVPRFHQQLRELVATTEATYTQPKAGVHQGRTSDLILFFFGRL